MTQIRIWFPNTKRHCPSQTTIKKKSSDKDGSSKIQQQGGYFRNNNNCFVQISIISALWKLIAGRLRRRRCKISFEPTKFIRRARAVIRLYGFRTCRSRLVAIFWCGRRSINDDDEDAAVTSFVTSVRNSSSSHCIRLGARRRDTGNFVEEIGNFSSTILNTNNSTPNSLRYFINT